MSWNDRIEKLLKDRGISRAELARGIREPYHNVNKWLRGNVDKPRGDAMSRIASYLKVSEQWLVYGRDDDPIPAPIEGLPVLGIVAAGNWLEVDAHDEHRPIETVPVVPDPRYPRDATYGLFVAGTSINRIASEGDILICTDMRKTGAEPEDGDLVIVERQKAGGALREVTAKRVRFFADRTELWPESDDPRWQRPIVFNGSGEDSDEEIHIIAIVQAIHKPLRRPSHFGARL